jgi:hypothetical protein
MKNRVFAVTGLLLSGGASSVFADQSHYSNVITGERAQGLAGAYSGVSDDASGVFYNPGGLAFAQSNDISGSANAFYSKTATYKKAVPGGDDWKEYSGGTFAPFFGTMQKLDKTYPGLVGGFAYYTIDTELKDQDSLLVNKSGIARYHRSANQRASTYAATGALAYRVSPSLGIGLSIGYLKVDELAQVSQNLTTTDQSYYLMSSARESLVAHGMQAGLGIQWAPTTKFVFGLSVRTGSYASQKWAFTTDNIVIEGSTLSTTPSTYKSSNPLGSMPLEIRGGVACYMSPRLLLTSDLDWHAAVADMDSQASTQNFYTKKSVLNYAVGSEYYMTPSLPLRLGYFTNKDASPKLSSSKSGQPDHIDYQGLSIFVAMAQPNSQISTGVVLQKGTGKAQKIGGVTTIQDVSVFAYNLGFSATHSF